MFLNCISRSAVQCLLVGLICRYMGAAWIMATVVSSCISQLNLSTVFLNCVFRTAVGLICHYVGPAWIMATVVSSCISELYFSTVFLAVQCSVCLLDFYVVTSGSEDNSNCSLRLYFSTVFLNCVFRTAVGLICRYVGQPG